MAIIEVKNLRKTLGGKLILDDVTFEVEEGDSFCLLGPNGAGKTTTIRVLIGIYRPDGGEVYINGFDISKVENEIRRCIGYLPENPSLYERLTIYDNLKFFGKLFDIEDYELDKRIRELTEMLGIYDRIDEKVGKLSKGLKQRVALARALINRPSILILDQPTSDLDPAMARSIRNFIRELNQEGGTTLLVCTHNLVEAEEICDKAALINKGRIIDYGFIDELKGRLVKENVFEIILLNRAQEFRGSLKDRDYVNNVKLLNTHTLLLEVRDKNDIALAVEELVREGAKIFEIKQLKPKLEDVYLELLGDSDEIG